MLRSVKGLTLRDTVRKVRNLPLVFFIYNIRPLILCILKQLDLNVETTVVGIFMTVSWH